MKVMVIGSGGQLGWELMRQAEGSEMQAMGLDLPEFDLTSRTAVEQAMAAAQPDIVINAAAYTAVDKAESDQETAFAVNRDGPALLASSCRAAGVPLIHISTDYVFDGSKKSPYQESDPVSPLGVYGRSKAQGEREVQDRLEQHLIFRTAWFYGVHGANFVKTMLRLGRERESLGVVNDQTGGPTYAADLAKALLIAVERYGEQGDLPWGLYHFCGAGQATWYKFALKIFKISASYEKLQIKELKPLSTSEYPTPAQRPANSLLDCGKFTRSFHLNIPPWEQSLTTMLSSLYDRNK